MPDPVALKAAPMNVRACKRCCFGVVDGGQRSCRFNPPQMVVVPKANPVTRQVEAVPMSIFPPVQDDGWCGRFDLLMGMAHSAN